PVRTRRCDPNPRRSSNCGNGAWRSRRCRRTGLSSAMANSTRPIRPPPFISPANGRVCPREQRLRARTADPEPVHIRRRRCLAGAWLGKRSRRGAIAGAASRRPGCTAGCVHALGRVGLDPGTGGLGEGEAAPGEGRNDFGTAGYRGPCPPPGHGPHRYVFRLYALDPNLELDPGGGKPELERAIEGHVLRRAELIGPYER